MSSVNLSIEIWGAMFLPVSVSIRRKSELPGEAVSVETGRRKHSGRWLYHTSVRGYH